MSTPQGFQQAIEQAGLVPPAAIPPGKLIRFPGAGKSNGNKAAWAKLFTDERGGVYGDHSTGLSGVWQAERSTSMTPQEREAQRQHIAEAQRIRQVEEIKAHAEAAKRAQTIWNRAKPAPADHRYLQRKQIQPHGLRIDAENQLIVPVMIDEALSSLQHIDADGGKQFLPGGTVKGGSYTIGELTEARTVLLCEGFATAASLYEATDLPVVCAFSAPNLTPVAGQLHQQFPAATIVLCGDNDHRADGKPNTGLLAATAAANEIGGRLAIPDAINHNKTDWNDVHMQLGLEAVHAAIEAAMTREESTTMKVEPILDDVYDFLGRFVAYPSEHGHVAHCLWIAHTHLMDAWESTPRLAFLSPEPGSGKTRAMELTETLVPRPVEAINVSSAYLFRKISDPEGLPTILHDEIDTIFGARAKEHEEIRGVINAGHRRGASAGRCVVKGKLIETEELPAFCAVAMAGLGNLPDTILSRSVILKMRRRAPGEVVQPYRRRVHAPEGYQLRDRLTAWATQIRTTIDTYPVMPSGITDRNADVWESLLSVADAAGGPWPERARVAAVALVADAMGGTPSLGIRLLSDLRTVFGDRDSLWTVEILVALINLDESPWGDLKGKPLDSRRLSNLLRPYGIVSRQVKIDNVNQRGYTSESLWDAWVRYLSPAERAVGGSPIASATSATTTTSHTQTEYEPVDINLAEEVMDLDL